MSSTVNYANCFNPIAPKPFESILVTWFLGFNYLPKAITIWQPVWLIPGYPRKVLRQKKCDDFGLQTFASAGRNNHLTFLSTFWRLEETFTSWESKCLHYIWLRNMLNAGLWSTKIVCTAPPLPVPKPYQNSHEVVACEDCPGTNLPPGKSGKNTISAKSCHVVFSITLVSKGR